MLEFILPPYNLALKEPNYPKDNLAFVKSAPNGTNISF
jgi:hypothetical protein